MLIVKQAAERACVSEGLIRQWIREGTLPHFRLGAKGKRGKIVIAVEDLDGVLAAFKVIKAEPEPRKAPAPQKLPSAFRHLRIT
ncbi:: HTH_17 [Gemmata massiliana]|uniref:: HTH_17 n=1 Tax=Gemmata massiliana TaxID=1210884 RepID=A0A6P2DEM7_9BACT|nr:helix-turn-helix domain-containing protein [Gemmata massiliana]VTS00378.1 : HTH_17 [Gemmata massiliana]